MFPLLLQTIISNQMRLRRLRSGPDRPTSAFSTAGFYGVMQQQVHQSRLHYNDEVKQRSLNLYHRIDYTAVDRTIDEWREHLYACVRANGLHFSSY